MAKRSLHEVEKLEPPELVVSREEAEVKLKAQLSKAEALRATAIRGVQELDRARQDKRRWRDYTKELLVRMFSNESVLRDFDRSSGGVFHMNPSFEEALE